MNTIIHIQSVKKTNTDIGISKSDMKKQQKMASNVEKKASQTGSITNTNVGNSIPVKIHKKMNNSSTDFGKRKSCASSKQTTGFGDSDKINNNYKNNKKRSKKSNNIKEKK